MDICKDFMSFMRIPERRYFAPTVYQTWNFFLNSDISVFLPSIEQKIIPAEERHAEIIDITGLCTTPQPYNITGKNPKADTVSASIITLCHLWKAIAV